jgi:hypothetical protein
MILLAFKTPATKYMSVYQNDIGFYVFIDRKFGFFDQNKNNKKQLLNVIYAK